MFTLIKLIRFGFSIIEHVHVISQKKTSNYEKNKHFTR